MLNRGLIWIAIIAILAIITLNVIPLFWGGSPETYIKQTDVRGMAIKYKDQLYTLNFDQQKRSIDIFNRALPVGDLPSKSYDPKLDFQQIIIYRFNNQPSIDITPIRWVENNLLFKAPDWSNSYLIEVSQDELHNMLQDAYPN